MQLVFVPWLAEAPGPVDIAFPLPFGSGAGALDGGLRSRCGDLLGLLFI